MPELLAVCRGATTEIVDRGGRTHVTGIAKLPVDQPLMVGEGGLEGDVVRDVPHHGGSDQALYAYAMTDYDHFAEAVGQALPHGAFGENLVLDAWGTDELAIGDRFRIGDEVVVEVTAPRIPCSTFAARMAELVGVESGWVKDFVAARRPGAYLRVVASGPVAAGMPVTHEPGASGYPMLDLWDLHHAATRSEPALRRALAAPIASRARREYEDLLAP